MLKKDLKTSSSQSIMDILVSCLIQIFIPLLE